MFASSKEDKIFVDCSAQNNAKGTISEYQCLFLSLEKKYGVISEHLRDSDDILKCIYFQDSFMKDVFNFYPDRLCIDVTHKYFETDICMYIFLCEDSNGRNEIISLGFLLNHDADSFLWLINTFKKHNPNWRRIKIMTVDPEIKQKDLIRNLIPTPHMVMCFHHAFKSFRKDIESIGDQNDLSNDQIQYAIDLFKSMYNAHSPAEYELYYQQFILLHSSVVIYFQETWMPLQHLWRTGLDFFHENIFSSLNCHLENLDNTYKSIFRFENDLKKFIEMFFVILSIKRDEKNMLLFPNTALYSRFSTEFQITKILTPYAAKFVIDQYDLSSDIHMDCSILSDNYYFDNLGCPVNASVSMCQCQYFLYMFLPCRHIFAVRKTLSLGAFDETLVEHVWTMKYYQTTLTSLKGVNKNIHNHIPSESVSKHKFVSQLLEKSLTPLIKTLPIFDYRCAMLNKLIDAWKNNKDIYLQFEGIELEIMTPESSSMVVEELPVSSQACKSELVVDEVIASPQIVKTNYKRAARRVPVSSKSFKIEYASSSIKINTSADKPVIIGSPTVSEISFKKSKWNFKSKLLDGNHINYAYLCRIICDSKETCIDWLRQMELICTNMLCPTCGYSMTMKLVPRLSDGAVWVCTNDMEIKQSCSRRCSVRRGSWFELTNMSFEQILTFCYMWINGYSQSQIISETGISTATYISWNKLNRRVCEECLMEDATYSCISKMDSTGYAQVLESWLQKCVGEDSFLKFLQDANAMHRKDSVKHSMG